jgi:ribosomal protein L37AE/L43A
MALHLDPFEHEPLPDERRARAADIAEEWRVARQGIEVVAHGALVCPSCAAPTVIADRLPAWQQLRCGFCGHAGRARTFLVRDVFDTVANEAYMVARLPG